MNRKKLLIGLLSIGVVSTTAINASASKLDTANIKGDAKFVESINQSSENSELTFDLTNPEESKAMAKKAGVKYVSEVNIEGDFETFDLTNTGEIKSIDGNEGFEYVEEIKVEGGLEIQE